MKVYSWNMLFSNRRLDEAFAFVRDSEFDVFCLQEVPEHFLERLKTLPCHLASQVDTGRFVPRREDTYLVILSRMPMARGAAFRFPDYWPLLPRRARLFVRLMRPFNWGPVKDRGGMYADIALGGNRILRVFNLHLVLGTPARRIAEFEQAMAERDPALPTVVCGDFNILEKPHVTPINWLAGGRMSDVFAYGRERTTIEGRFVAHELMNALSGSHTHPFSRSQLDHILLSKQLSVQRALVIRERRGSDHNPIRVDIA